MEYQVINGSKFYNGLPIFSDSILPAYELPFERSLDQVAVMKWFNTRWSDSIYWCIGYLIAIVIGQKLMANRPAFKLRKPLFFWNLALSIFSIVGALRGQKEFTYILSTFGFRFSVCDGNNFTAHPLIGFWASAFVISKLFELGDTAFIVLRKQKLLFLHWYHHITVFTYCWFSFQNLFGPARWYVTMNFTVHAAMYTYYTFRSIGIKVPKPLAMTITIMQIAQMFAGSFVAFYAFFYGIGAPDCPHVNSENNKKAIYFALVMYGSYLFLFCQFFWRAYFQGFAKAVAVTSGKEKKTLDENANNIDAKKVK